MIAEWTAHYDPLQSGVFAAQACDRDVDGSAIAARAGDQLVLRYTASTTSPADAYIPNGDGAKTGGRVPSITLPP